MLIVKFGIYLALAPSRAGAENCSPLLWITTLESMPFGRAVPWLSLGKREGWVLLEQLRSGNKRHQVFLSISWLFPECCLTTAVTAGRCRQDFGITVFTSYFFFSSSYSIYFVGSGRAGETAVVCHQGDQKSLCFLQSTGALQPWPSQARFCCWWGLRFRFLLLWPLWHEEIIEGLRHSAVVFAVCWFSCSNPLF